MIASAEGLRYSRCVTLKTAHFGIGVLCAVVFVLCPISVSAQDAAKTFAVVDLTKVFLDHPETEKAQEALNEERAALREVFKKKSEALKEALQKHQEEIRAGKQDAAVETLNEVNTLEKAIATLRSTQQNELEQKFAAEKSRVLKLIRDAVAAYNVDGRYALILDASAAAANGLPMVLDAPGADDITDAIIAHVKTNPPKAQ